jgi:hypothetical protein
LGYVRTQLPAYVDEPGRADLAPRPYTAVAADDAGALVTAAIQLDRDPTHDASAYPKQEIATKVADGLRAHPGDRLVRQLARCAREFGCRAAANAFYGRWECPLPIAAAPNERPAASVAPRRNGEADPTAEPSAAFHPTTDEIARLAVDHLAGGGTMLGFGRVCEGEPLQSAREIEDAIARIRLSTRHGTIHLDTNGSLPGTLRRLRSAGLDSICIRMASARAATYETLHGPDGYRFADVRASLRLAAELRFAVSILVLVLPGVFDRTEELSELGGLLSELPEGSGLLLRDLHADPLRALARVQSRGVEPLGVSRAIDRIREQAGHVRIGAFVRPLVGAKVSHVP